MSMAGPGNRELGIRRLGGPRHGEKCGHVHRRKETARKCIWKRIGDHCLLAGKWFPMEYRGGHTYEWRWHSGE